MRHRMGRIVGRVGTALLAMGMALGTQSFAAGASRLPSRAVAIQNVNVSRLHDNQNETGAAVDQTDPMNVVITSNIETGVGLFHGWSTDGGLTWQRDIIADGDPLGQACCDSQLASDEFGNVFLTFVDATSLRVKVAVSTDGGATFSPVAVVSPPVHVPPGTSISPFTPKGRLPSGDQPSIAAGAGSVWVSWTSFATSVVQASGAPVTGLGQVGPFKPTQNANGKNQGDYGDTVIGPNGEVMVVYQEQTGGEGPTNIYTDLDPDGLGPQGFQPARLVAVSNVGGFDYIPAQDRRSVDAETALAWDRSGGPHHGRLYFMYTSERPQESNDLDIQIQFSDDSGLSWTEPHRVNDDATKASQFLPRFALDQTTGNVAVAWYDCRNDDGNHGPGDTNGIKNDDAVIYAAVTRDGGITYTQNFRVGAGVSNSADSGSGLDFGDYEALAFHAGNFYPVWADNSNSTRDNPDGRLNELDIYTARVRVP